ncbi:MAG TPA: hypothetical protein VJ870_12290 [Amycolatopsis sp.]|nr:hypothetical protein [Amycolatopsis sp.]
MEAGPTRVVFEARRHPYTKALLEAVPRLPWRPSRRAEDPGRAANRSSGRRWSTCGPLLAARSQPDGMGPSGSSRDGEGRVRARRK